MKRKPTIKVADNGNLQIHITMLIQRMRGRKQVALDGEIPEAAEPVQAAVVQALTRAFPGRKSSRTGQIDQ